MLAIWAAVDAGGMVGAAPGFTGGSNGTALKVAYTSGLRVSQRFPSFPQPRLIWMEAAFAFSFS